MTKENNISKMHKRALEHAKTGKYLNWKSVEFKLRQEGFSETMQVLDSKIVRDHLDSLCNAAQLPEEVENRDQFRLWLSNAEKNSHLSDIGKTNHVTISAGTNVLFISGKEYVTEIKKQFSTNHPEISVIIDDTDGIRKRISPIIIVKYNFNSITEEETNDMVIQCIRKGESAVKFYR